MSDIHNYQISITPLAIQQIKNQLSKRQTPDAYLRLGVAGGKCSGFSYVLRYEDEKPKEKEFIFNIDGVKIVIDCKSIIVLNGITLDWEKNLMKQGFKFINSKAKNQCGCGESFDY